MSSTKPQKKAAAPVAKGLREKYAAFFEDPSRDKLRELVAASGGEFRNLDFKAEWPERSALAKQVLGLGNIGGGVLIIGVSEEEDGSLSAVGLSALKDKADIVTGLGQYIPPVLLERVTPHNFEYPTGDYGPLQGKFFQALFVEPDEDHVPFVATRGGEKIVAGAVYVRRDGLVEQAGYDELQRMLNRRIESNRSTQGELDLRTHLDQLKVLFAELKPVTVRSELFLGLAKAMEGNAWIKTLGNVSTPNPAYPTENYEAFVARMIARKKDRIADVLDVRGDL